MSGDIFKTLFSYAGWYFLPNLATSFLQTTYYKIAYPVGRRHPQPGEALHIQHRRRIYTLVITSYLIYTIAQTLSDISLAGTFYSDLSLPPTTTPAQIRSRFRRLASKYHPDKITQSTPETQAHFVRLKLAQDTLVDPATRFAYERFGPGIVTRTQGQELKSIKDYVYAGFRALVPEYIAGLVGLVAVNVFWLGAWGRWWRYAAFAGLVVLELYFLTHQYQPWTLEGTGGRRLLGRLKLDRVLPETGLLPFQIMTLARRGSISLNYFISQLAPLQQKGGLGTEQGDREVQERINRLGQLAKMPESEATSLLSLSTAPFKGDRESVEALRKEMLEGLVTNAIRARPEVRKAVQRTMERRVRSVSELETTA